MADSSRKSVKAVVSSNNFQELVDALVEKLGLKFDMVLGWQSVNFAKGPEHFEHARKSFNCDKGDMVFIGDSLKDADRARDYGIDFIAKTGTFSRNEFKKYSSEIVIIDSLVELNTIL